MPPKPALATSAPFASLVSSLFRSDHSGRRDRRVAFAARRTCSHLLESLESRQMLSTVSINDFGAVANDGRDDSQAISAAIRASSAGDTIEFGEGTYTIAARVEYDGNRTYKGVQGKTILHRGDTYRQGQTNWDNANNITFDGLTFDGTGILLEGSGGASNITVQNCVFQNMNFLGSDQANMLFINGLKDSKIVNNVFQNIHGDNAIIAYNLQGNVLIANNLFNNVNEGIHITNFNAYAEGIVVAYNEFAHVHRMGVEIQENPDHQFGGFDGLLVQGNYLHDFDGSYEETFALSIVSDLGTNTVIKDNIIDGTTTPGTGGNPTAWYGIEAAGINTIVENNQIANVYVGVSVETGQNGLVQNNTLKNIGLSAYWIARHPGVRFIDNIIGTGGVTAPADGTVGPGGILLPSGGSFGSGSHLPGPYDPDPIGSSNSTLPPLLAALALDTHSVQLSWTNTSNSEDGFRVERSVDMSNWSVVADLAPNTLTWTDTALNSSTIYYYRVYWYQGDAKGPLSNIASALTSSISRPGTNTGGTGSTGSTGSTGGSYTGVGTVGGPAGSTSPGVGSVYLGSTSGTSVLNSPFSQTSL